VGVIAPAVGADRRARPRWIGLARAVARKATLVVAPTLVVCLVLLEVGLRLRGDLPSNATDGIFQAYGKTYRLRPGTTKLTRTPSYTCTVVTNSLGLRDATAGVHALGPAPYFAFVGDSITFANGVDYADSFVGTFARAAATQGLDVVNLAVGGHRLPDQEILLRDFLATAPRPPRSVVVVFTKEFITGFERDASDIVVKNGYLFSRDRWVLPFLAVWLGDRSAAYGFFRDGIRRVQGRITQANDKDLAAVFLEDFSRRSRWAHPATLAAFDARLDALDALVRRAGAAPIYVYMPVSRDLDADRFVATAGGRREEYDFRRFHDLLARHAARDGIRLLDLTPVLQRLQAAGERMTFMQDPHYTPPANRAVGEALAAALLDAPPAGTTAAR
jgi:hypothetical protein